LLDLKELEGRRNFFSKRAVDEWNKLPNHAVEAESTDQFKKRLDERWGKT